MSPEFISKLEFALEIIGAIAVIATIVAHLTPNPKDDGVVKKIATAVFKIIAYMPTIGVNPKTKELEKIVDNYGKDEKNKQDA